LKIADGMTRYTPELTNQDVTRTSTAIPAKALAMPTKLPDTGVGHDCSKRDRYHVVPGLIGDY